MQDIVTASPRFDMAALVPQLREYLTVLDSRKRMFLISWTTVLASVPDIDMLAFLPSLLGGLMDALQDDWREVRTAAGKALQVRAQLQHVSGEDVERHGSVVLGCGVREAQDAAAGSALSTRSASAAAEAAVRPGSMRRSCTSMLRARRAQHMMLPALLHLRAPVDGHTASCPTTCITSGPVNIPR